MFVLTLKMFEKLHDLKNNNHTPQLLTDVIRLRKFTLFTTRLRTRTFNARPKMGPNVGLVRVHKL